MVSSIVHRKYTINILITKYLKENVRSEEKKWRDGE